MLLHDAHFDDAIERAISSTTLHPTMIIEVAEAANERGKKEEAMKLTLKALKQGFISADESVSELIKLLVKGSNERELKPKFNTSHVIKAFIGLILNINVCESNLFILSLFIMAFTL